MIGDTIMKKKLRFVAFVLALWMILSTAGMAVLATPVGASNAIAYTPPNITKHEGGYDTHGRTLVTHAYDFSIPRLSYYATDESVAIRNINGGTVQDGALTSKDGGTFAFGSAVCLGDDYGLENGYLSFDLCLEGGSVTLGVRTSRTACTPEQRGLWFVFDGSQEMKIYEPISGLEATVAFPYDLGEAKTFSLHDGLDTITLSCGDDVIATIEYAQGSQLSILNADGEEVASTTESDLYTTGYFELYIEGIDGYVDNVVFTNVEVDQTNPTADELRTIDYSTWTATDDLDRTVADATKAGEPQENRYVGVFYFLCWVGAGVHVQDNTKLYVDGGMDAVWDHFDQRKGGESYWAEPYFGYYRNTDTWVYRKHAYMLEQAGVDFVYLDVSNAEVFISGHTALFDTWLQMRKEGIDTPQIVFFNGDTPEIFQSNMNTLFTTVYSDENWKKYEELFFMWDGKPLIFGNQSGLSGATKTKVLEKFTVRGSWAWVDKDNYWSWLQEYKVQNNVARLQNGGWGRDAQGQKESLAISLGHHPTTSKGRSFVNDRQPNNGLGDLEFSSVKRAGQGLGFEFQFNAAMRLIDRNVSADDPFVLMITGWNEWIAGCNYTSGDATQFFCNNQTRFFYVDAFNAEFSRDAEPMRNYNGYGFGDNYYYQMVDYIRQFKGMKATPVADNQTTVSIYDLSTWDGVSQTYMDSLYDVELRNTMSYDADNRYINGTGRNDFDFAKVSQDNHNLYFLVKCTDDIIIDNGDNWMNLFINVDGKQETGWEGYDYVLNRDRDSYVVTVEKFKDGTFESEVVGGAYYALQGAYLTIRLPKSLVGVDFCDKLIFKWADNSVQNGDPMAFMDLGDTAPDNRFGFVYLCEGCTTQEETPVMFVSGELTATPNGTIVQGPSSNINITVENKGIDVLFSMEDEAGGSYVTGSALNEYFEIVCATSNSRGQYKKTDNGIVADITGYCDLRTWQDIAGIYTFKVDCCLDSAFVNSIYIRGEMPGSFAPVNKANAGINQVFDYYEWDWYNENGGRQMGGSSTAGSGICISPKSNHVGITIKRYAPDGLTVASASVNVAYPQGFQTPADGWVTLSCEDDGENVKIRIEDMLLCTIQLENPGVVYESDGTGQPYYGLCTVLDAAGKQMLQVENTRLNSQGSQLALATRDKTMQFDNICIAFEELVTHGDHIREELLVQEKITYTAQDRLRLTLALGDALPEGEYVDPSETQKNEAIETVGADETYDETNGETDMATDVEASVAVEDDATNGMETSVENVEESDDGTVSDAGCGSVVMVGVLPAVVLGVACVMYKSKKEENE